MSESESELKSKSSPPCYHHYNGFCRRAKSISCPLGQHLQITCSLGPMCMDDYCREVKRHPRLCKYYLLQGFCKMKEKCQYFHYNIISNIQQLVTQNQQLRDSITTLMGDSRMKNDSCTASAVRVGRQWRAPVTVLWLWECEHIRSEATQTNELRT